MSHPYTLKRFSEDDPILLKYAVAQDRVVCTRDADFLRLARAGEQHADIVFFDRGQRDIGHMVTSLRIAADLAMEEMRNRIEFR